MHYSRMRRDRLLTVCIPRGGGGGGASKRVESMLQQWVGCVQGGASRRGAYKLQRGGGDASRGVYYGCTLPPVDRQTPKKT